MQGSNNFVVPIFKSRQTILDQLDKAGYDVSGYANFSIAELHAKFTNKQLDMFVETKKENPETGKKRRMYIWYYLEKLIRPANIQDMIDDLFNIEEKLTKDDTLLIVSKDEVNDTMVNFLKHIWETERFFVIVQSLKRLQFNIQDHTLVPPHRILVQKDVDDVKKKYNISSDNQFPDISRFDPVAQSIYMRPGDVCEITRPSKTAITANYYRLCI